jgi:hypothetical protein
VLGLGVNDSFLTAEGEADCEQRRIADHVLQVFEARGRFLNRNRGWVGVDVFD